MFTLIDLVLLFALLSLLFYILIITAVLPASLTVLSYIFLVVAILLFVVWIFLRILGECTGGRYRYGRNRQGSDNIV